MKPSETPPALKWSYKMERKLSQDFYFFLFFFAMLRLSNLAFDEKRKNESAPNEL